VTEEGDRFLDRRAVRGRLAPIDWRPVFLISVLFAAFLGYNPIQQLLGAHALAGLWAHARATLTGQSFFPHLISAPLSNGLDTAFAFAIVACLVAAAASLLRGGRYRHEDEPERELFYAGIPELEESNAS
jgi:hypothetical protein